MKTFNQRPGKGAEDAEDNERFQAIEEIGAVEPIHLSNIQKVVKDKNDQATVKKLRHQPLPVQLEGLCEVDRY